MPRLGSAPLMHRWKGPRLRRRHMRMATALLPCLRLRSKLPPKRRQGLQMGKHRVVAVQKLKKRRGHKKAGREMETEMTMMAFWRWLLTMTSCRIWCLRNTTRCATLTAGLQATIEIK